MLKKNNNSLNQLEIIEERNNSEKKHADFTLLELPKIGKKKPSERN